MKSAMSWMSGGLRLLASILGVGVVAGALGADCVWTGAGDGTTWNQFQNWKDNAVPGTTDTAIFDQAEGGTINLPANVTISAMRSGAGDWRFTGSQLALSAASPFPWGTDLYPKGITTFENEVRFTYTGGQRQVYGGKIYKGAVTSAGSQRIFFAQQYKKTITTIPADAKTAVVEFVGPNCNPDLSALPNVCAGANTSEALDAAKMTIRDGASLKAKIFFNFVGSTLTLTNNATLTTTPTGNTQSLDTLPGSTTYVLNGGIIDCKGKFNHGQGSSVSGKPLLYVHGGSVTAQYFINNHGSAQVEIAKGGTMTIANDYTLRNGAAPTCLMVKDGTLTVNGTMTVGVSQALNFTWVHGGAAPNLQVYALNPSTAGNQIIINLNDEDGYVPGRIYTVLTETSNTRVAADYKLNFNGADASTLGTATVENGVLTFTLNEIPTTWTGAAGDGRFSSPGNWSGNAVPANGATLYFPNVAAGTTLENDLTDFQPARISFGPSCGAITITGNAMTGLVDIDNASDVVQTLACSIAYAQYLDVHQPAAHLAFTGGVTCLKPLEKGTITDLYGNFTFTNAADSGTDYSAAVTNCWRPAANGWAFTVKRGSTLTIPGYLYFNAATPIRVTIEEDATMNIGTFINRNDSEYFDIRGTLNIDHLAAFGYAMKFSTTNSTGTVNINTLGLASNANKSIPCSRLNIGAGGIVHEPSVKGVDYAGTQPFYLTDGQILGALTDWTYAEREAAAERGANYYVALGVSNTLDTAGHTVTFAHTVKGVGPLTVTGGGALVLASHACRAWTDGLVFTEPTTYAITAATATDLVTPIFRTGDQLPAEGVLNLSLNFVEPVVGTYAISEAGFGATAATLEKLNVTVTGDTEVTPSLRVVDGVIMLTLAAEDRSSLADWIWTPVDASTALDVPGNWSRTNVVATALATAGLYLPPSDIVTAFTYNDRDPVALGTLYWDGKYALTQQGGLSLGTLDMGKSGRLVLDPLVTDLRLARAPNFANGAQLALATKYADYTKGRFLLMTWDAGVLDTSTAAFANLFDSTSAAGVSPALSVETIDGRGYLWLDLDSSATYPTLKVLPLGDSITEGKVTVGNYGNWRITYMKAMAAAGYDVQARGFRTINSEDQAGASMPARWCSHSGVSGYRITTSRDGSAGHLDTVGNLLDEAGEVDVVLLMLGTNDIEGGADATSMLPNWSNLVAKIAAARPTARVVAGTVVDRLEAGDTAKRAQVVAFNTALKNLVAANAFRANQVFVADTYDVAPTNLFFNTLHPDFPGMVAIGQEFARVTQLATAVPAVDATAWTPTTTMGAAANVPSNYMTGFKLARTLKPSATGRYAVGGNPYEDATDNPGVVDDISRVGYYIELKRKDTATCGYGGHVRWMWVDMDAWGDCSIREVGFPVAATNLVRVSRLHVASNEPLIAAVPPTDDTVFGWVQAAPCNIDVKESGSFGAPTHFFGWDWNDSWGTSLYGAWQVHRLTPNELHAATTLFAFNRWARADDGSANEVLLGDFAQTINSRSMSGIYTYGLDTMNLGAYESMTVEIYTKSREDDPAIMGASSLVNAVEIKGTQATVTGELTGFGTHGSSAMVTLEWSENANFASVTGSVALGLKTELGALTGTATDLIAGKTYYFRFKTTNDRSVQAASTPTIPYELVTATWRASVAGASWGDAVWMKEGAEVLSTFTPSWNARFDGAETSADGTIVVQADVNANSITIDAAKDYTFNGVGRLMGMGPLVKTGAGTLTIDGAGLGTARDMIVSNGVLRLGEHALEHALGTGGKLEVAAGGQFDLNFLPTDPYDPTRVSQTRLKKLVLAGEGPDGRGALVNDAQQAKASFRTLELTGDATIGGTKRIDLRDTATGIENIGAVSIEGAGHTLTVANSDWFLVTAAKVNVGGIVVTNAGIFRTEGAAYEGVDRFTLVDGGAYHAVTSNTVIETAFEVKGTGGALNNTVQLDHTGTFNVDSGATLSKEGGGLLKTVGGFVNEGTVKVAAGTLDVGGTTPIAGDGAYQVTGGTLLWRKGVEDPTKDLTFTVSAGSVQFGDKTEPTEAPKFRSLAFDMTGGVARFWPTGDFLATNLTIATRSGDTTLALKSNAGSTLTFDSVNVTVANVSNGENIYPVNSVFTNSHVVVNTKFELPGYCTTTFNGESELRVNSFTMPTLSEETRLHVNGGVLSANPALTSPLAFPLVFGSEVGDAVTFNLGSSNARLRTALTGPADVTMVGETGLLVDDSGKNIAPQGVPTGKWTVSTPVNSYLKGASAFGGGLELADNALATLYINGSNTCALAITSCTAADATAQVTTTINNPAEPLFTVNNFNLLHAKFVSTDTYAWEKHVYDYTGEFYVDEADLGDDEQHRWSFAGTYDDRIRLEIDGNQVFSTSSSGGISQGVVTGMTAGWHSFRIIAVDGGGTYGPTAGDWAGVCSLGWTNGYTTATTKSSYRSFTMDSFRAMRPRSSMASRIDWQRVAVTSDIYSANDEWKTVSDWTTNGVVNALSMLSRTDWAMGKLAVNRFTGWVYVGSRDAGTWEVSGSFDDFVDFWLDGVDANINGRRDTTTGVQFGTVGVVTEGWHRFELRTYDRGGGWGPWTSQDRTIGKCIAIRSTNADGEAVEWRAFDETNFVFMRNRDRFGQFLPAGLHGTTKVGSGASLTNEGTLCPIWGKLTGEGTLWGGFRFAGEDNALLAEGGANQQQLPVPTFENNTNALVGLKGVEVVFDRWPALNRYTVGPAQGLTAADVAGLRLSIKDAKGRDYTRNFTAQLVDGNLVLDNACPSGLTIILR